MFGRRLIPPTSGRRSRCETLVNCFSPRTRRSVAQPNRSQTSTTRGPILVGQLTINPEVAVRIVGLPISNYVAANNIVTVRQRAATNPLDGTTGAIGAFYRDSKVNLRDLKDGPSNTILVGERAYELPGPSGAVRGPAAVLFAVRDANAGGPTAQDHPNSAAANQGLFSLLGTTRYPLNHPYPSPQSSQNQTFTSNHSGGCQFLMGDGRVIFLSEAIDARLVGAPWVVDSVYEALVGIRDNQPVGEY